MTNKKKYNEDIIEYPLKTDEENLNDLNKSTFIEKLQINELQIEKYHPVDKLETVYTKYGSRIVATLCIGEKINSKDSMFLPKRFDGLIFDNCIKHWNGKGNLGIEYQGGKYNDLKFEDMNYNFFKYDKNHTG